MPKLGVNVDHIATLRQARGTRYPDPISAAVIAESNGADQITVHLRGDRRHIQDCDLGALRKIIRTALNQELAAEDEIIEIALLIGPDVATFVPEQRQELTTEGGLDVVKNFKKLKNHVTRLKDRLVKVSMFVEADLAQIEASRELGAEAVELHTGRYAELKGEAEIVREIARLKKAAIMAGQIGLYVAAGHGLNYDNTARLAKEIPEIVEYNIGHAIIARAVFVGLGQAVAEMKKLLIVDSL